jgi:hypothetical protein
MLPVLNYRGAFGGGSLPVAMLRRLFVRYRMRNLGLISPAIGF